MARPGAPTRKWWRSLDRYFGITFATTNGMHCDDFDPTWLFGEGSNRARGWWTALLESMGGLAALARADTGEIEEHLEEARVPDPRAAAERVSAAFALGRHALEASAVPPLVLATPHDVVRWAMPRLAFLDHEELWMFGLDDQASVLSTRRLAAGCVHVGVSVRDVLRMALRAGATGFALVHNHPGGDPTPSAHDKAFTRSLAEAAAIVDVPLLDHVVVGRGGFSIVPGLDA